MTGLAVLTVTRQGIALGEKILAGAPEAVLYVPAKYGLPPSDRIRIFEGELRTLLPEIYPRYAGFLFLMATGIVVRMIADYIRDKRYDPAIVVMDITGRFAISLVSGHLGGANALARRVAEITGATAVITTGTDVNETIAPDMLAQEMGGAVADFTVMKKVSAALVDSERVGVVNLAGVPLPTLAGPLKPNVLLCDSLEALAAAAVTAGIVITNRLLDPERILSGRPVVLLRPRNLAVGVGCNRGTAAAEIREVIERVLLTGQLALQSVGTLATIEGKREEAGLLAAAEALGLPIAFFTPEALNAVEGVPNPSAAPLKYVGAKGVAEPAAILAAGEGRLVVEKVKSGNVTVAVAEAAGGRLDP